MLMFPDLYFESHWKHSSFIVVYIDYNHYIISMRNVRDLKTLLYRKDGEGLLQFPFFYRKKCFKFDLEVTEDN